MSIPFLLIVLCLLSALAGWTEVQYLDVITLTDGQSFKGLIVEQTPEGSFRLETLSGSVLSFAAEEILEIRKERSPGTPEGVRYQDVVFLKDGTIFRGNIVEQVLGEQITLQTDNEVLLPIRFEEIWKIVKQKHLVEAGEEEPEDREVEELKRQVQISLELRSGKGAEATGPEKGEAPAEELAEEVERLKEEIQSPEDTAAAQRLEAVSGEIEALVGELMEMTKGMWTEEIVGQAGAYKQAVPELKEDFQALLNDLLAAAAGGEQMSAEQQREAAEAFREKLEALKARVRETARARRQEEVQATEYVLEAMIAGEIWLDPEYRSNLALMSTVLPREQREALFEQSRRTDALSAAAMNLIPILALGSWKQRDGLGAITTNLAGGMGALILGIGSFRSSLEIPDEVMAAISYLGIGLLSTGEVFAIVRPFFYSRKQNQRLAEALGLAEKKVPESTEYYDSLKRYYVLLDPGSVLYLGPRLETGVKVMPETTLGAEVFFPAFGLIWQIGNLDGSQFAVLPKSVGTGVNAKYFFKLRYSPHRVFIGFRVDFVWNWLYEQIGTPMEVTRYEGHLLIRPSIGYRLRFPSGLFLSFGTGFGVDRLIWNKWWFNSDPDTVFQDDTELRPNGGINICLGWEF
jgi:hypothetical protein